MGGLDRPGQSRLDSDLDSIVGIHSESILLNDMTKQEKHALTVKFALGLGMAIIVGMLFNLWQMHDRLVSMSERMQEWQHLIDFLTIWIRENGLTITPPGTGV